MNILIIKCKVKDFQERAYRRAISRQKFFFPGKKIFKSDPLFHGRANCRKNRAGIAANSSAHSLHARMRIVRSFRPAEGWSD